MSDHVDLQFTVSQAENLSLALYDAIELAQEVTDDLHAANLERFYSHIANVLLHVKGDEFTSTTAKQLPAAHQPNNKQESNNQ